MKAGRVRTLRGQIEVIAGVARKNIVVADGLINYGLKINKLLIWPTTLAGLGIGQNYEAILSLDTVASGTTPDASDNRQFAWFMAGANDSNVWPPIDIIDPDHIVNRDLFLSFVNSTPGTYNYLIEAQAFELSDNEAIVSIIKETSQS